MHNDKIEQKKRIEDLDYMPGVIQLKIPRVIQSSKTYNNPCLYQSIVQENYQKTEYAVCIGRELKGVEAKKDKQGVIMIHLQQNIKNLSRNPSIF